MTYEVEIKFPVLDLELVERRIQGLGGVRTCTQIETDCYFRHPIRDFAHSDEALRIRQIGSRLFLTYKGPRIDRNTKTRREIEPEIVATPDAYDELVELLCQLGFQPARRVDKQRCIYEVPWKTATVTACLDAVKDLGEFVELELLCTNDQLDIGKESILTLAHELGLAEPDHRSYLEMLLNADTENDGAVT